MFGHSLEKTSNQLYLAAEWHWQKISLTRLLDLCSVSSSLDSFSSKFCKKWYFTLVQLSAMVQAVVGATEHTPSILTRTGSSHYIFRNILTKAGSFHSFFNSTSSVLRMDILRHSISELRIRSKIFVGEALLFSHAILIPGQSEISSRKIITLNTMNQSMLCFAKCIWKQKLKFNM